MDELVKLVALCHSALHDGSGRVHSVDVKWVDPEGTKHVVVEMTRGGQTVEVDWKASGTFELKANSSKSHYREARLDITTAEEAFRRAVVLMGDDDEGSDQSANQ